MVLALTPQQIADISAHAESTYPEECCGLMLGMLDKPDKKQDKKAAGDVFKSLVEVVSLANHWEAEGDAVVAEGASYTKRRRYTIDPRDMLKAQKQAREKGLSIIGIYHSHPDHVAVPSECDRAQAWPEYAYVIVSVQGNQGQPAKVIDFQNWALDSGHQFQPEAMRVSPSSARDRMPVSA